MSEQEIEFVANFMLDNNLTIRKAGKIFNIPKSTLHYNLTKKIESFNYSLFKSLHDFLQINFNEKRRHSRHFHSRGRGGRGVVWRQLSVRRPCDRHVYLPVDYCADRRLYWPALR